MTIRKNPGLKQAGIFHIYQPFPAYNFVTNSSNDFLVRGAFSRDW